MNKIARFIHNAWQFLQGKKTVIGAGLIVASSAISVGAPGLPLLVTPHAAVIASMLFKAGVSMGGLGLANKVLKWAAEAAPHAPQALE